MTFQVRSTDLAAHHDVAQPARHGEGRSSARRVFFATTLGVTLAVVLSVVVSVEVWDAWAYFALVLFIPSLLWISGGAATAFTGVVSPSTPTPDAPTDWRPKSRTAILLLVCREDPQEIARNLAELIRHIAQVGLQDHTRVIVLSDTFGESAIASEAAALRDLIGSDAITYRRRDKNTGRKPGNIAEWFDKDGANYDQMLVLDADSRMSGLRIAKMIWQMESRPDLGLLQAGMSLLPARTRFGQIQRTASRLLGPSFGQGLAAWSGSTGNYWGHNALIRTKAFSAAAHLPSLSGAAPFGGDILSHDFIEAAVIRSKGWAVCFDHDTAGSAEDGPQDLAAFHRRNRRWCQGNLQHIRLINRAGFHPMSRLHIASGIFSFLAGPVWLLLVLLMGTGLVKLQSGWPFVFILAVLLVPKLSGLWRLIGSRSTAWRRRIAINAFSLELMITTLLAPIVMLNHTASVLSVLAGRDCGWKQPSQRAIHVPQGVPEALCGILLFGLVASFNQIAMFWIVPIAGPMILAPFFVPWLNGVRSEVGQDAPAP